MDKYDIGKLKSGTRVKVGNRQGTVHSGHEPQWRDHQTKMWMHVLQGADVIFDDEKNCSRYIHCNEIELI
jgi:hypothetical protein